MLFKNLKSGNLVEAKDDATIGTMKASPNYEEVKPTIVAPAAEASKPAKKTGGKASKPTK